MRFIGIDNISDFEDEKIFWISLTDPPARLKSRAKLIDGEAYSDTCFAVWVSFYPDTGEFEFVKEKAGDASCSVFYIDNDGERHYFPYEIPEALEKQIISECRKKLDVKKTEEPEETEGPFTMIGGM